MRFATPDDAELMAAIRRYVIGPGDTARYRKLLGGNFMTMGKARRGSFLQQLGQSARQASDHDLCSAADEAMNTG